MNQQEKYETFKSLHERSDAFVIPNPWDTGTARILASLGFEALATTSAGYGFAVGKASSQAVFSREEIIQNAKEIVEATDLPVSADLEGGFGDAPEACAETMRQAMGVGLVGGSIEDATGNSDAPIYDFGHAVERVAAACEATANQPFLMTARAESYLYGRSDLDDTIKRLQAFSAAGADVLYAPGLPDLEAIKTVCDAVDKPVNVVMGLSGPTYSVDELQAAGVKRISVGGSFARAALAGFVGAATEVKEQGTFGYAKNALPHGRATGLISNQD